MSNGILREALSKRRELPAIQGEFLPHTITSTRKAISKLLGDVSIVEPSIYSLTESRKAILNYFRSHQHLNGLKTKYIRHIPYLIFDGGVVPDGAVRLEALTDFEDAYFQRVSSKPLNSVVNSLLHRLITEYPDLNQYRRYYEFAKQLISGECTSYRCEQYLKINKEFHVFSVSGTDVVWNAFVGANGSIYNRIDGLEFPSDIELEQTKFFDAVVKQGINEVRSSLSMKPNESNHLIQAVMTLNFGLEWRYNYLRHGLIESLLTPFAETSPHDKVRDTIKEFLIERYGDPRINADGQWNGISEEARSVILSWLVEDALEDFFRLFSYVAESDKEIKRHWKYREAFWKAYLDKGHIDQAWVVLGHRMDKKAIEMLSLAHENYGKFAHTKGVQTNQAALVMKIGGNVVTEWNYNGKYRVWSKFQVDQGNAPVPYKKVYESKQTLMMNPAFDGAHFGSDHYSWQRKLSEHLTDKTGRRVSDREYRLNAKYTKRNKPRVKYRTDRIDTSKLRRGKKKDTGGMF